MSSGAAHHHRPTSASWELQSHLFEDIGRGLVGAVKDDIELLPLLHLLEQWPGVLTALGELANLNLDAVSRRSFDQLLQPNQTWNHRERHTQVSECRFNSRTQLSSNKGTSGDSIIVIGSYTGRTTQFISCTAFQFLVFSFLMNMTLSHPHIISSSSS